MTVTDFLFIILVVLGVNFLIGSFQILTRLFYITIVFIGISIILTNFYGVDLTPITSNMTIDSGINILENIVGGINDIIDKIDFKEIYNIITGQKENSSLKDLLPKEEADFEKLYKRFKNELIKFYESYEDFMQNNSNSEVKLDKFDDNFKKLKDYEDVESFKGGDK